MYNIKKIMAKINHEDTSYTELLNLHENVMKSTEVSEEDRELISEAVVTRMRVNFPAKAKKKFGAKDAAARELLQKIFEETESKFDLSGNSVKNGVKTGGHMISGKMYVNVYLSYKNKEQEGIALSIDQRNADSEFEFYVNRYCTKKEREPNKISSYRSDEFSKAGALYREYLYEIIH